MNAAQTRNARDRFIEAVGLTAEADGFTRIGGRLFGLLLVADGPRTIDDLAAVLGVSKASVSTDTRRLLDSGVVERVGIPRDRRAWYRIAPDFFGHLVARRIARWSRFAELVAQVRRDCPDASPGVIARLRDVERVNARIVGRIAGALDDERPTNRNAHERTARHRPRAPHRATTPINR